MPFLISVGPALQFSWGVSAVRLDVQSTGGQRLLDSSNGDLRQFMLWRPARRRATTSTPRRRATPGPIPPASRDAPLSFPPFKSRRWRVDIPLLPYFVTSGMCSSVRGRIQFGTSQMCSSLYLFCNFNLPTTLLRSTSFSVDLFVAHCCSPPDVERCRLLLITAWLGRRCSMQTRERTTGV